MASPVFAAQTLADVGMGPPKMGWANGAYPPVVKAGFGKSQEIPQHWVLLMGRSAINGGCSMDDPISSIGG
jgi:hypothetical protein